MPSAYTRIALALTLVALALPGCITRTVTETAFESRDITIHLRGKQKGSKPVDRGYQHPSTLSPARLANILAAVSVRTSDDKGVEQSSAIATSTIKPTAKALSEALGKANSSQELAVVVVRKASKLGLFNRKFVTSFVAYVKNDFLYLYFSRVDWQLPKQGKKQTAEDLPLPKIGDEIMAFRTVTGLDFERAGPKGVAARWRDPVWTRASHLTRGGSGQFERRTILMESEDPAAARDPIGPGASGSLSPETLRALADLEEQRRSGEITESQYRRRREEILGTTP
ncbi:MAG: hypothetical protein JRG96_13115 [Deltaproteobacteria bacterium]|nr:hypothetical protein [Deltaproteobacteria bacterium]MBW2417538.1 hypothetical protein [Deltaproteobacteria bacterium]